jgi:hypothetical protein
MTYNDNWTLVCKLHKLFLGLEKEKLPSKPVKDSNEQWWTSKAP